MHNLIFGPALFYDIPEYLQIVSSHSFWQSIVLGHFPIHPIFMMILWPLSRIFTPNVIAIIFFALSIFVLSRISKKASLIFLLFPAVWIMGTNLMVESLLLFFFILAFYFLNKDKKILFLVCCFLMIGIHLEVILWIPALFLTSKLLGKGKEAKEYIGPTFLVLGFSLILYLLLYRISGRNFGGATEQLGVYLSSGILRMLRNIWLTFSTSFGSLTIFVLGYFLITKFSKNEKFYSMLLLLLFSLVAANWQGDFMMRRSIFFAIPLSLILAKYLGKWWWIFIVYLLPITFSNILLYSKGNPFLTPNIPGNQILLETHYLKPFTKYDGNILYIGENDLSGIDEYLNSGKKVYLTSAAVNAPYRLLVGNNYHITSLGKIGNSESRFLFKKYDISKFENVYEIKEYYGEVSPEAGESVIFYGDNFWQRIARRRINYGDMGVWVWSFITNHKDPVGWTYKDATGAWVYNELGI